MVALNNPAMLLRSTCSNCNLRESCLPTGLTLKEIERLEELVTGNRRRIKRGESLFRAGDRLTRSTPSVLDFEEHGDEQRRPRAGDQLLYGR